MVKQESPATIDTERGELLDRQGRAILLRRRSLGVLITLARGADRVVSKEEIIDANWPGSFVSDESLARCVSDIRSVFGAALRPTVRTASGRGYMLSGWQPGPNGRLTAPADLQLQQTTHDRFSGPPSIAVLPFVNVGGSDRGTYFSEGIAQGLIDALSRVRWFFVIAKGSSFVYRDRATSLREIGSQLEVRYILDGSVRTEGSKIRISGRLVEAETGRQLWVGHHEGVVDDVFGLQDEITANVLAAVEPNVRFAEIERSRRKPTSNLGAYDLYLQALPLQFAYTRAAFGEAEKLLREAVARDGNYSDALAALSDCVGRMALNGWTLNRDAAFGESCALAGRAIAADPQNPSSLATAAWAYAMFGGSFEQSLDLAAHALTLHPNSHTVRSYCGWVYTYAGQSDAAIEHFDEARRLSPVDPRSYFPLLGIATSHYFARRFEETARITRRILFEVPEHNIARRYLAAALAQMGNLDAAAAATRELLSHQPNYALISARGSRFRHAWMLDLWLDGLRRAGVPEEPRHNNPHS